MRLTIVSLLLMVTVAIAQNPHELPFSDLMQKSDLIIKVKVIGLDSRWVDDDRGKHIYTFTNFKIVENLKGNYVSDQFTMEIAGGKVGDITEYVSTSFIVRENQEIILFLSSRDIYSNVSINKKLNVTDNQVFLENKTVAVENFSSLIKDISQNRLSAPKTLGDAEKLIDAGIIEQKKIFDNNAVPMNKTKSIQGALDYNLKPYTPSGWSAPIVVSTVTGTKLEGTTILETNDLFIDWAVQNGGSTNLSTSFNINLYIDDVLVKYWTKSGVFQAGYYISITDYSLGRLTSGSHTIKLTADPANSIAESNESDNIYTKNIFVQAVSGIPSITQISPSSASAGTGTKVVITGSNFGTSRGSSKVEFFYQSGEPEIESNNYVSWTNTRIECEVPIDYINDYPASAGSGPVTVTTSNGTSGNYYYAISFGYGGTKWTGNPAIVKYRINENLSSMTGEGAEINSATSTWNNAGANFSFVNDGTTTKITPTSNGINEIMWGTISDPTVLAQASYWMDNVTGNLKETDICFNNSISWSKDNSNYDVQTVVLHEFGHWLNLRDLYGMGDADKVMYGYAGSGVTKRTLSTSDIDGIKWIYGSGSPVIYTVTTSSNPSAGGTTSGGNSYNTGTNVTVSAVANTGYTFTNWTENGVVVSTSSSYTFNISGNKTLVANFSLNTYTLTITSTNGTVAKNPDQANYNYGTTVTLLATPNAGYSFTGWSGDVTGSANPLTVTMNGNKNITANYSINTYSITVTSSNGTVAKNPDQASYNFGTTVTLTATPNTGYTFTGWSGDATGSSNPLTVTMNGNKSITANYSISTFSLTVTSTNGTVAKNPDHASYNYGTTVTLTATPNAGYSFTGWSGDVTGSANPLTVTMNGNKSITANYSISTFSLTVTSTNGTVAKNPDHASYNYGTTVTLTATPAAGYTFVNWSGDAAGSSNPLTVTMNGNKNITANYSINTYSIAVTSANGTVAKNPDQASYNYGTTVTLTATPAAGYTFVNWSGDATGSANPITVTMNGNKNITANYSTNIYSIAVTSANGTVTKNPDQASYNYGTTVTLTATPAAGYTFINWSGDATGSTNPLTVTMNGTKNITANYSINTYVLTLTSINGTVTKNPDQASYNYGTTVTLTATPAAGYTFANWSGDATGSTNPLTVTMNGTKNITANYSINTYSLTVTSNHGTITKNPDQASYNYGTAVTLTATPNAGYSFTGWSGDATGSTNPFTVTMNGNKNITANYSSNTYSITVTSANGTVTKNPDQANYNYGTTVTLTATPAVGYTFVNWGGDATGPANPVTVTMKGNKNIIANFSINTYSITVTSTNGTVTKNPDLASYNYGTAVTLTATPAAGYAFTNWDGDATGSTNPITVTMNGNKNITANYSLQYSIKVKSTNGTVIKNPDQESYNYGTIVTLTATPAAGYTFINWSGDATGPANPVIVTVNDNKNITANYSINTYSLTVISTNGTVTKNPEQASYDYGTIVTLTATSAVGYTFTGWSGDVTGSTNPLTVMMNGNKNITANFSINTYSLTVISINGTVAESPDQTSYNYGTLVKLSASPSVGYIFSNWGGDVTGTNNPIIVTINGNKNIESKFVRNPILSVAPEYRIVPSTAGTTTFEISNAGGGDMDWKAVSDSRWIAILSGVQGLNSGTIKISFGENSGEDRIGTVTVSSINGIGSPKTVEIRQEKLTDVEKEFSTRIYKYLLSQNFPNPFNPETTIRYQIPKTTYVQLIMYDGLGREVETLVSEVKSPGNYEVRFEGRKYPSGIYFYQLRTESFTDTKKFILMN